MTRFLFLVALGLLFGPAAAHAQSTYGGTVTPGAAQYYSFTPGTSGQFIATLSWDNPPSTLLLILVCGTSDPITFGAAAAGLDRTARLEAGLIGLTPCIIGVSTTNTTAAYRLNLLTSSSQPATPRAVTASSGPLNARLVEAAAAALTHLQSIVR